MSDLGFSCALVAIVGCALLQHEFELGYRARQLLVASLTTYDPLIELLFGAIVLDHHGVVLLRVIVKVCFQFLDALFDVHSSMICRFPL